ncbi:hypothetical protein ROHU_028819 [Labeo rohita]|uniref:Uncharacterized protein n=1 Tax=Labeo rohita TaxID=84645 RepID=A0A498LN32_LABRO|nr:hypothetical protein ROHU_031933 [Labeo rohita]RXN14251.1 hypothetical protein ROHU_028819 [Labeo rohita]
MQGARLQVTTSGTAASLTAPQYLVLSQSTISPIDSTALAGNQTVKANDTMATNVYVGPANTTTAPAGTGVQTQASALNVLVPVAIATGLLQRWC